MLRKRIIPIMLISDRRLVKTVKFRNLKYVGDPLVAMKIYEDYGADEIMVLDISTPRPDFDYIQEIADRSFTPLSYGGGIKDINDVSSILGSCGFEKVVFSLTNLKDKVVITESVVKFGSQACVGCVDYHTYYLMGGHYHAIKKAERFVKLGCGEIIFQCKTTDGTFNGLDTDILKTVDFNVPVVIAGGCSSIDNAREASELGADAVAAGSLFIFNGKNQGVMINYPSRSEVKI